ncbi:hypothetical protein GKZ90_0003430 [Flavobacterium sp. MC2016-06]|jgi:hypothetical protein|uniref:hypothetical protein n=1 Tax=Flavobacterium sp. MC2016-06 TaxID=2676308 RepID=UPI0012BAC6B2|nr:hypothetical protein [Flavobacterium sp. MC2016-06]MBU3860581.1 hypothetical protein [Flavobacterium sp. MC2016-06]
MKIKLSLVFFLICLSNYSQSKIAELYKYEVNTHLIKNDENLMIWLDSLTSKMRYSGHNFSTSYHQESSFNSFNLLAKDTLLFRIPKTPLKLSFKTEKQNYRGKFSQTIITEYNIPFYSKSWSAFEATTFQYKAYDYFILGLKIYKINNQELIANILNRFIDLDYKSKISKFDMLINDVNLKKNLKIPLLKEKFQNIEGARNELSKVTDDIPKLLYEVYIYDKKGEEKTWKNVQEFYNFNTDNIKKYLDDYINDFLVIKLEKPELIVFPENWMKEKDRKKFKNTAVSSLYFDRIIFLKNQYEHIFEVTFELANTKQIDWCYGVEEHYKAMKGKKIKIKATLENPISITPDKVKIFVYPDKIRGILMDNQYTEIELFNSKLTFK